MCYILIVHVIGDVTCVYACQLSIIIIIINQMKTHKSSLSTHTFCIVAIAPFKFIPLNPICILQMSYHVSAQVIYQVIHRRREVSQASGRLLKSFLLPSFSTLYKQQHLFAIIHLIICLFCLKWARLLFLFSIASYAIYIYLNYVSAHIVHFCIILYCLFVVNYAIFRCKLRTIVHSNQSVKSNKCYTIVDLARAA